MRIPDGERRSTGVRMLDRRLGGGIPPGSLVAFTTPADAQSEALVRTLLTEAPALYCSTVRPPDEIQAEYGDDCPDLTAVSAGPGALLAQPAAHLDRIPPDGTVVIDTADELERRERSRYLSFLNSLKERVAAADGVALLRLLSGDQTDARQLTLDRSDLVWRLEQQIEDRIETRLVVSKFRQGTALDEPVKIELGERVRVDTSRDIA